MYYHSTTRFSWDVVKAASNLRKHGISFSEAVTVFRDPLGRVSEDLTYEERSTLIGHSSKGRVLYMVFAEYPGDEIRIISARRATAHERRLHEEGKT